MFRQKLETSEDLREIERSVDSLAMTPPDEWGTEDEDTKPEPQKSSFPSVARSVVLVLETLPPNARVIGLALILAAIGGVVAWRGGF